MSLIKLQQRIGVTPDNEFGPITLRAARDHFKLTSAQAVHFFAQCGHETDWFRRFEERFNYTPQGLLRTWPKHFPTMSVALAYVGDDEAIANRAYANRMGNGPATSGGGWLYRGRGALHLTGRANYQAFADSGFPDVMDNPSLVATDYAFDSALWFFERNKIWPLCKTVNEDSVMAVTRKVNGGTNGFNDRLHKTVRLHQWLKGSV